MTQMIWIQPQKDTGRPMGVGGSGSPGQGAPGKVGGMLRDGMGACSSAEGVLRSGMNGCSRWDGCFRSERTLWGRMDPGQNGCSRAGGMCGKDRMDALSWGGCSRQDGCSGAGGMDAPGRDGCSRAGWMLRWDPLPPHFPDLQRSLPRCAAAPHLEPPTRSSPVPRLDPCLDQGPGAAPAPARPRFPLSSLLSLMILILG